MSRAFYNRGHNVTSCDLEPREKSQWLHVQGDVLDLMRQTDYDLIIAHPPCTYLCNAGIMHTAKNPGRWDDSKDAFQFVLSIMSASAPMICIENPKGLLSTWYRKPDQIIYPWQFGDPYRKDVCLWLKGIPPLLHTQYSAGRKSVSNHVNGRMSQVEKSKIKSKFFPGIADAMATQWG